MLRIAARSTVKNELLLFDLTHGHAMNHHRRAVLLTSLFSKHRRSARRSTRLFASEAYTIREMDAFTQDILRGPMLGTLTPEKYRSCRTVIANWLSRSLPLSGYAVDSADRLWQRLLLEKIARNNKEDNLFELGLTVLARWLEVSANHPHSELAVQKADQTWKRLVRYQQRPNLPTDQYLNLLHAWLRLENGMDGASELLLSKELHEMLNYDKLADGFREQVVKCIREVLQRANTSPFELKLVELMEIIDKDSAALPNRVYTFASDRNPTSAHPSLQNTPLRSSFEQNQLLKEMISKISKAGYEDRFWVEEEVDSWNQAGNAEDDARSFALAIFDFYIRIDEPTLAGQWLPKIEQLENAEQISCICRLIDLWSNKSTDPKAPWRIDECLGRLELISSSSCDDAVLINKAYLTAVNAWVLAKDKKVGSRKALELINRAPALDSSFISPMLLACLQDPKSVSNQTVAMVAQLLENHWTDLTSEQKPLLAENALRLLGEAAISSHTMGLLESLFKEQIPISPRMCELAVKSLSKSTHPDDILALFSLFDSISAKPGFQAYSDALSILFEMRRSRRVHHLMKIFNSLLDKMATSEIVGVEATTIQNVVSSVVDFLAYFQRDVDVLTVLQNVDMKLNDASQINPEGASLVPMSAYTQAMSLFAAKGSVNLAEILFDTIQEKNSKGTAGILPDREIYNMYISALAKTRGEKVLKKQLELLKDLINNFSTTGNEAFRPRDRTFNIVLSSIAKNQAGGKTKLMISVIDDMIQSDIEILDAFGFNTTMGVALKDREVDSFKTIMELYEKMKNSNVKPNQFTLNTILLACGKAKAEDYEKALELVLETVKVLRSTSCCSKQSYVWAVQSVRHVVSGKDKRSRQIIEALFKCCCEDGCLDTETRSLFKKVLGEKAWDSLHTIFLKDGVEPEEWSRSSS